MAVGLLWVWRVVLGLLHPREMPLKVDSLDKEKAIGAASFDYIFYHIYTIELNLRICLNDCHAGRQFTKCRGLYLQISDPKRCPLMVARRSRWCAPPAAALCAGTPSPPACPRLRMAAAARNMAYTQPHLPTDRHLQKRGGRRPEGAGADGHQGQAHLSGFAGDGRCVTTGDKSMRAGLLWPWPALLPA